MLVKICWLWVYNASKHSSISIYWLLSLTLLTEHISPLVTKGPGSMLGLQCVLSAQFR